MYAKILIYAGCAGRKLQVLLHTQFAHSSYAQTRIDTDSARTASLQSGRCESVVHSLWMFSVAYRQWAPPFMATASVGGRSRLRRSVASTTARAREAKAREVAVPSVAATGSPSSPLSQML